MFAPQAFQVTPSIWCIRRRSSSTCSCLLTAGSEATLIDAGMVSTGADVWRGVEVAGIAPERVRRVFVTHWHNDHGGVIRAVQDESALKLLSRDVSMLCPGHRRPLTDSVAASFAHLRDYLENDRPWPLLEVVPKEKIVP